jgi:hypothetical protein
MRKTLFLFIICAFATAGFAAGKNSYKDPTVPIEKRVED